MTETVCVASMLCGHCDSRVADGPPYDIVIAPGVRAALAERLPEPVANAIIEFITGPLLANPHRVGKALRGELAGRHSARRGSYRVIYRIDEAAHEVHVLKVDHRGRVYRSR